MEEEPRLTEKNSFPKQELEDRFKIMTVQNKQTANIMQQGEKYLKDRTPQTFFRLLSTKEDFTADMSKKLRAILEAS